MDKRERINIVWLRRDLRLHDNHALHRALTAGLPVLPVFIFDQAILSNLDDKVDRRVDFIYQALQFLNDQLRTNGRQIVILHGYPAGIWRNLLKQFQIHTVFVNRDYEPYARQRDAEVAQLLQTQGVHFESCKDQVVFEPLDILKADKRPYTVYSPYRKKWEGQLSSDFLTHYPSEKYLSRIIKSVKAAPVSLSTLGFKKTDMQFRPPRLNEAVIGNYHETRDFPATEGTSRLSVHLRFGTVSIRHLVRRALELNDTWLGELIWREFFMMILYHFPHVAEQPFRDKYRAMRWIDDAAGFERWVCGKTGYPLVDAGMRELNATGFMHNRVRMLTASFLTKHLLIDWRKGEAYFARKLLDFDLASNNGNWQWAAGCGCDAAPYFRIFNPTTQAQKFDPRQEYIRKWIPELDTDQYPKPVVEHTFARLRALNAFKQL